MALRSTMIWRRLPTEVHTAMTQLWAELLFRRAMSGVGRGEVMRKRRNGGVMASRFSGRSKNAKTRSIGASRVCCVSIVNGSLSGGGWRTRRVFAAGPGLESRFR